MRETSFIAQNQEKWSEFEAQLKADHHEPEKLNELYVQITDDLSYARTFYPNRSVRMYLNNLAQRVFHNVYRGNRFPIARLRNFWSDELPQVLWETRRALLLAFGLFAVSFAIGMLSSSLNPDFSRLVLGDQYVDMTLENIQKGDPMAVYKDSGPLGMSVGIAANNLFVALRTAIFGVLASIGTVFIMLYNGIMVGAFQYFFIEQGVFWESFLTIWIHGTLEISAIIIAGAAGLVAGSGLLFPGTYTRVQAFQLSMRKGLKIFIGVVPVLILAAFFEGFLTRFTDTPAPIRAGFIAVSLIFVLWYFVWLPWHKARHTGFKHVAQALELLPDRETAVDFSQIKSAGEIVSETFLVLKKYSKTVFLGVCGAIASFLAWTYALAPESLSDTFVFSEDLSGVFYGVRLFFNNGSAPYLFVLQVFILAALTASIYKALAREMTELERPNYTGRQIWAAWAGLLLPAAGFVLFMQVEPGLMAWMLAIVGLPFLSAWAAAIYFGHTNLFSALMHSFRLFHWKPGVTLGFLTVNLGLLFYFFLDTEIWRMTQQLFSWLVPSGDGNMATFTSLTTTIVAGSITYVLFLFLSIGGALAYFSNLERIEAGHLHAGIREVGTTPKIRGLAKE